MREVRYGSPANVGLRANSRSRSSTIGTGISGSGRASSKWTIEADEQLIRARAADMGWDHIARTYFRGIVTGNACRKRHERIQNIRRAEEWDNQQLDRFGAIYVKLREAMWSMAMKELGTDLDWKTLEKKAFSQGLKALKSHGRKFSQAREHTSDGNSGSDARFGPVQYTANYQDLVISEDDEDDDIDDDETTLTCEMDIDEDIMDDKEGIHRSPFTNESIRSSPSSLATDEDMRIAAAAHKSEQHYARTGELHATKPHGYHPQLNATSIFKGSDRSFTSSNQAMPSSYTLKPGISFSAPSTITARRGSGMPISSMLT